MAEAEPNELPQKKGGEAGDHYDWILDTKVMLGCLKDSEVNACSISRVPDKLRKSKEDAFIPKVVSIGPFHKGTCDLQLIKEITKWQYMHAVLHRARTERQGAMEKLEKCIKAIRKIDPLVRAIYAGDSIKLEPHELARIMLLDGCFFLELLLRLHDFVTGAPPCTAAVRDKNPVDPIMVGRNNKILPVLIDLTLLENQIPFIVLKALARELSEGDTRYSFPTFEQLAKSLFDYNVNSFTGVCHFLHLMHLSSSDPYGYIETSEEATQELKRCATKLQAVGIKIQASHTDALTDTKTGIGASALRDFVDRFDLKIELDASKGELKIPPLRIKEGTEVKWRNLIAWEQSGIGVGFKFTSYALFFKGLICSVHDIELLKAKNVIVVDDSKMRDEALLDLFGSITIGVEQMDDRYSELSERLNSLMTECPWMKPQNRRMLLRHYCNHVPSWLLYVLWRYCRWVLAWLRCESRSWIAIFIKDYIPNPWAFIGILAATVVLVLTIMQTYYASQGN